jgi:hypothetical protein
MALTEIAIKQAKHGPKPIKLADEKGLFLLLQPSGGKLWRLKYRFAGKEKKLGLAARCRAICSAQRFGSLGIDRAVVFSAEGERRLDHLLESAAIVLLGSRGSGRGRHNLSMPPRGTGSEPAQKR